MRVPEFRYVLFIRSLRLNKTDQSPTDRFYGFQSTYHTCGRVGVTVHRTFPSKSEKLVSVSRVDETEEDINLHATNERFLKLARYTLTLRKQCLSKKVQLSSY